MLYFANWKVLLICGICALGVLLSLPNLFTPAELARLPSFIPHRQVALGLDLRGGSYLLLEVDVAAAQRDRLGTIIDSVRSTLRDAHIGYTGLNVEGDAITFTIREPDRIEDAKKALAKIDPDLTVEIGSDGSGTMKFSATATESRRRQAVEQSIEIIRRRIDETVRAVAGRKHLGIDERYATRIGNKHRAFRAQFLDYERFFVNGLVFTEHKRHRTIEVVPLFLCAKRNRTGFHPGELE